MTTLTALKKNELLEYILEVHNTDLSESGKTRDELLSEAIKLDAKAEIASELDSQSSATMAALDADEEEVDRQTQKEKERAAEAQPEGANMARVLKKQSQYKVRIFPSEGDDGSHPVKLSINGYAYLIPRDKESIVPESVVNILKNAVVTQFYYDEENNIRSRDVRRYNFESRPVE
ncbi:MAG: hypothetical protein PVI97_19900 [Candidatus Thiodiazotropha sp.]|jgi:hypothetical protein